MSMFRMMGFGDLMGDDPFFGHAMRQMDNMMNMMPDPFGMMGGMGPMGHMNNMLRHNPTQEVSLFNRNPFGHPMFPMPNINSMFQDMHTMAANDPNAHSFSSSTMMTMVNGPDGRPQVYQASSSTRSAPGGVRETKKSVVDTRTGTKKMAIGHHIGERAHIMEREQNTNTGQIEGRDDLINIDLEEKDEFEAEWQEKSRSHNAIYGGRNRDRASIQRGNYNGSRAALPALPPSAPSHSSTTTANLRAKARAAAAARRNAKSSASRVEITEITDEDDDATSPGESSSSPIIEYPTQTQSQSQRHDNARRSRSREIREREREGSRKRDLSDDDENRHKYKSRRSRQH